MEAAREAEQELREQGWRLDESLEEFQWHQQREEKQRRWMWKTRGHALATGQGRLIVSKSK